MFKFLCSLLLALAAIPALAADAETTDFWWFQAKTVRHEASDFSGYYEKSWSGSSFGFYAVAVKDSTGYAELYMGPTWKPVEGVEFGLAIGRENTPGSLRYSAFASYDNDNVSLYTTFENGGTGLWHKTTAVYKFSSMVNVGLMHDSGLGTGPRVEYNPAKDWQVWGAVLRTGGKNTPMVAVSYSF